MVRAVSLSANSKPTWLVLKSVSTYCKETIVQITTRWCHLHERIPVDFRTMFHLHLSLQHSLTPLSHPSIFQSGASGISTLTCVVFDVSKMSATQTAKKTRKRTATRDSILLLSDVILSVEFLKALYPLGSRTSVWSLQTTKRGEEMRLLMNSSLKLRRIVRSKYYWLPSWSSL